MIRNLVNYLDEKLNTVDRLIENVDDLNAKNTLKELAEAVYTISEILDILEREGQIEYDYRSF